MKTPLRIAENNFHDETTFSTTNDQSVDAARVTAALERSICLRERSRSRSRARSRERRRNYSRSHSKNDEINKEDEIHIAPAENDHDEKYSAAEEDPLRGDVVFSKRSSSRRGRRRDDNDNIADDNSSGRTRSDLLAFERGLEDSISTTMIRQSKPVVVKKYNCSTDERTKNYSAPKRRANNNSNLRRTTSTNAATTTNVPARGRSPPPQLLESSCTTSSATTAARKKVVAETSPAPHLLVDSKSEVRAAEAFFSQSSRTIRQDHYSSLNTAGEKKNSSFSGDHPSAKITPVSDTMNDVWRSAGGGTRGRSGGGASAGGVELGASELYCLYVFSFVGVLLLVYY